MRPLYPCGTPSSRNDATVEQPLGRVNAPKSVTDEEADPPRYSSSPARWHAMATGRRRRARATGIGGVFLKSRSPTRLAAWYRRHLGFAISPGGQVATWDWRSARIPKRIGSTLWAALDVRDRVWGPGRPSAQVNYRVDDLDRLLAQLRRARVKVDDVVEESTYGRFGWAYDPEGNRFELWEPPRRYRSPERHTPME